MNSPEKELAKTVATNAVEAVTVVSRADDTPIICMQDILRMNYSASNTGREGKNDNGDTGISTRE